MKLSIALATFNGAAYLQEQLDSFGRQTRLPDELVVCDDQSTDDTLEILRKFRQSAGFEVRIHGSTSRLGYIRNFERALLACSGDIIFLSDQDDVWFDGKLAAMSAILAQDATLQVLLADMVLTDGQLRPTRYTQHGNILDAGMPESSFVAGCGTALKRGWLDLALPLVADVAAHDNWIHRLAIALDVRRILRVPQQFYRRHEDNASASRTSNPEKITAVRSALRHGLDDATTAWTQELARVLATRDRIASAGAALENMGLLDRQAAALRTLESHASALSHRIRTCRTGRLRRVPEVLKMWVNGEYRYFAGGKSAIKDVLRP